MSFTLLIVVAFQMAIIFNLQSKLESAEFSYRTLFDLSVKAADHAIFLEEELKSCQDNLERESCEIK